MAVRLAADARARSIFPDADCGGARGELPRYRRLWRPAAELYAGELPRRADVGADLSSLYGDAEIHGADLVLHPDHRLSGRLFPGVPCPKPAACDRAVPGLHGAVLDLEHHPDDLLDSATRKGRAGEFRAAWHRLDSRAARGAAVFRPRRGDRLCPSTDDLHGGSDLQFDGAHRQAHCRSRPRRRREPARRHALHRHSDVEERHRARSIFVISIVMGDFFVVKVMSGGSSASVVSAFYENVGVLQYPIAAASAVILTLVLIAVISLILRAVDIRREITR